jgi:hypothetical protein
MRLDGRILLVIAADQQRDDDEAYKKKEYLHRKQPRVVRLDCLARFGQRAESSKPYWVTQVFASNADTAGVNPPRVDPA